ncbi:methyl-accepting chemotaxis protein [Desulfovibrio cuneatus]|uniref:methyl-accepting chemotaxis protein n=1 Tax=Desulfovibrio cuneatus TaxID=159728 RepID=UPI0003FF31CA|nr:methyl-accepting chemotaxis protein [Desulfovibrio cuneatus]
MTTKYKIGTGFCIMILISITVAFIGHRGLTTATHEFQEYRRLARLNTATSDLVSSMNALSSNMFQYFDSYSPELLTRADQSMRSITQKLADIKSLSQPGDSMGAFNTLQNDLGSVATLPAAISDSIKEAHAFYANTFLPSVATLVESLNGIQYQALSVNNAEALASISNVWDDFSRVRATAGVFSETRNAESATQLTKELQATHTRLESLGATLHTTEGLKNFAKAQEAFTKLNNAFKAMNERYARVNSQLERLLAFLNSNASALDKVNITADETALKGARAFQEANSASQQRMVLVSACGILLGIAFALYISFGLIRVLRELHGFAEAVSRGNFTFAISVREKGEIGETVTAMRQIPVVLQRLITEAKQLSNKILAGQFRERISTEGLPGTFAELGATVNDVSNAYTAVLDAVPAPLMTCNKLMNIEFLNTAAQGAVGGNKINIQCASCMNADACNSDKCLGKNAMAKKGSYTGETIVNPQGTQADVSVTATPLKDTSGEIVGFLEIITDLTDIKSQQKTMLAVARDASEVASRVAAASEELSSQVELITRGAELQRSRVESTATAMAEMNVTVLEVARNAGEAAQQSDQTQQKAVNGEILVEKAVESINAVNKLAEVLQEDMQKLGSLASNIDGVVLVISDIADQTNLLALNAAIEAARAGEAGRGFAVVADEVRKLAEKTMNATQEVSGSIHAIQQSARVSIEEVQEVVNTIRSATEYTNASGDALREIVSIASASSAIVSSIATAAEQQSATSEEINHAIDEISSIAVETSDGMLQSSQAVQDLARTAQELDTVMERLKG